LITKIKSKLSLKVFFITSGILITTTIITFLFFLFIASRTYISELDKTLDKEASLLIEQLKGTSFEKSGSLFDKYLSENNAILELYTADNKPVDLPTEITSFPDGTTLSLDNVTASENGEMSSEESPVFNAVTQTYNFSFSGSDIQYTLDVTGTRQNLTEIFNSIIAVFPIWLVIVLLISILAGWFYSSFITKPIKELSKSSIEMANLNFNEHCEIKRMDEIGVLGKSLNMLSNNLSSTLNELKETNEMLLSDIEKERLIEKKRLEFFSSISHELKTPLTVLRGQLEGMIQGIGVYSDKEKYLRKTLYTVFNMEKMVQEILTISQISANDTIHLTETDISSLVTNICYMLEDTAALNDMIIHPDIQENLSVLIDTNLIQKVFSNIIVNGIKYSAEGSDVFVTLKQDNSNVVFTCLNTNAKIPSACIPDIFDAFYRVDVSRNKETGGTGLGLYIVKTGLELHHAAYSIENVDNGVLFTAVFHNS